MRFKCLQVLSGLAGTRSHWVVQLPHSERSDRKSSPSSDSSGAAFALAGDCVYIISCFQVQEMMAMEVNPLKKKSH